MGVQAWIRAFTGPHLFVFLPQAIAWTRMRNGSVRAAERFIWITKWWSQIAGWISSLGVLFAGMLIIELFYMGGSDDDRLLLLSPRVADHRPGLFNIFWYDRPGDFLLEMLGWFIWLSEFTTWFMFYWSKTDAIKYAKYMIAANSSSLDDSSNPF